MNTRKCDSQTCYATNQGSYPLADGTPRYMAPMNCQRPAAYKVTDPWGEITYWCGSHFRHRAYAHPKDRIERLNDRTTGGICVLRSSHRLTDGELEREVLRVYDALGGQAPRSNHFLANAVGLFDNHAGYNGYAKRIRAVLRRHGLPAPLKGYMGRYTPEERNLKREGLRRWGARRERVP